MKKRLKEILAVAFVATGFLANAQQQIEMADTMRSEGKIYVVVAIILVVLIGLLVYLFSLDRKITRLENRINSKKP